MKDYPEAVMQTVWRRQPKPSHETIERIIRGHEQRVQLAHCRLLNAIFSVDEKLDREVNRIATALGWAQ